MSRFKKVGLWAVSKLRYPRPITRLVNYSPINLNIYGRSDATIERGVELTGTIELGDQSVIKSGSELKGEIFVGQHATVRGNAQIHTDTQIGEHVRIGANSYLQKGDIIIGRHTNLVRENEIYGDVTIGRYCAIAPHTIFQAENHQMSLASTHMTMHEFYFDESKSHNEAPIQVGNDVWIGARSIILPDVSIGNGAIIGAGSIVTKDVEPYSIVAGSPAEHIDWRFDEETRKQLQQLAWWEWSDDRIEQNYQFFNVNLERVDIQSIIE